MKHILLIATGGTIASKDNGNGLTPSIDVNILLEYIPAIRHICSVNGISIMNIDSSNMNTDYIARISECIKDNYDKVSVGKEINEGMEFKYYLYERKGM